MRIVARLVAVLAALAVIGLPAAASDTSGSDLFTIPFASGAVDPAADLAADDPRGHDLVLVQWRDFADSAVVHDLAATGATLVQPLAPVSYLVWADAAQTRAIRKLAAVRFAGVLPAETRVAPSVDESTTLLRVTLVGDEDLDGLPQASLRSRAFTAVGGAVAVVQGGITEARLIAQQPRVYSVAAADDRPELRDEQSSQIVAQGTDEPLVPGYLDFLAGIGADGSGVIVSVVDGGVDGNHPDLLGQVVGCYDYTAPGGPLCLVNNTDDAIGHGTHVTGVIMGTGALPVDDTGGFRMGQGVAPGAKVIGQNAISLNSIPADVLGLTPYADGYTPIYTDAVRDGATVSNNSWGPSSTPQGYDDNTREFDQIVRDADPETEGDQPITLSWSIMNGSGGTSTQGAPDEAKNIIAVGGSGSRGNAGPDDLCTCTAHGPNLDGRRLVDVVAPAQSVISTRATQGVLCGTAAGGGIVHMPPSPFHGPCTGTSFASPHVSGVYAVFVDWYRQNIAEDLEVTPSPALVKAAMINTAEDLSAKNGRDADGRRLTPIPNDQQGWGRVNLGNLIEAWDTGVVHIDQDVAFTASGQSHTVTVEPIDPTQPLRASLTWTDAPGHGQGGELPAWVNDLDLAVTGPDGSSYLGNVFADGFSVPGGEPDRMNNAENVFVREPAAGTYTVSVDAANIIGQASPSADSPTWQDFALVISNARIVEDTSGEADADEPTGPSGSAGLDQAVERSGNDRLPRR
jgi:serine protease AprX